MAESDEFYQDEEIDHLDPNIRAELRKSRERAKEATEARAELDSLRRELAFTKAGIPESGVGALLRKAYDGDNDPEAIRRAADEYGIFNMPSDSAPDPVHEELERHRSIAGATGSNTSGPTNAQSIQAGIENATSAAEVMEVIERLGTESGVFTPGMR
jgi:hypothetical protein